LRSSPFVIDPEEYFNTYRVIRLSSTLFLLHALLYAHARE
jgi:hypothetical protein